ncbi:hypothetical protein ACT3TZ_14105 [Brachybacterium sp. AOP25-B2-12]|uniref:hypothetical protein n=1 Tax=Brachybacterium sp. AOP25-B2-12 TaxID=3457710 RepID=UPI0040348811
MCTDLLRRIVGLGLAGLLVLPLAGCTVEGPGSWRYRGDPLLQAEKDLAAITEVWREHVRTERGPRALPADSACYLRISAPHDVDDEVVCGPLIVRGPRWESASIASYYERDGKVALTLTGSPEDAFSPVADAELGAVRAADGTAPDSTATPIAPVLPTLQPGEVRPLAAVEDPGEDPFEDPDPDHDDGFRLIDATDRFLVARLRPVDPSSADNAAIDVVAPEGHRLMVVEVTDLSADPTTQDQVVPTTLTIRAGDDAAPQVVEVPGATAPGTSDGNTEDPARGRWVAAVPAGQEVHLDLSDGDHVASAGSAPGDLTNDFPGPWRLPATRRPSA